MKQFLGMLLCFAIIVGTVWGLIISFSFLVQQAAVVGVPPEVLHFSSGVVVGVWWKEVGKAFMNFSELVFQKVHEWIVWR